MGKFDVKAARIARGLSQEALAEMIGTTKHKYSNKERGEVNFTFDEKVKLTRIFGWSYNEMNQNFFNGKLPDGYFSVPIDPTLYVEKPA